MEEEESDDKQSYERQKTEGGSADVNTPKYLDKDFDEEFEASYRAEPPRQSEYSPNYRDYLLFLKKD